MYPLSGNATQQQPASGAPGAPVGIQPSNPSFISGTTNQNYNGNSTSNQANTSTSAGGFNQNQANQYTAGQQQLQGQVGNAIGGILAGGQIPGADTNFVNAQNQAYTANYNENVAPQEAAQGGAGSPAIGSNLAMGLEQLDANLGGQIYQTNANAFNTAEGAGVAAAYNAVGQNQVGNNATTQNTQSNQTGTTSGQNNSAWQSNSNQALGAVTAAGGLGAIAPNWV